MQPEHIFDMGAGQIAAAIARGDIGSLEAVEAHIARIEAVNPALNAVVARRYDAARGEARAADAARARGEVSGPLQGVPVTIKDSIDVAGLPSTFGLAWRANLAADSDSIQVARLRAAGAIPIAKTNVAQLLIYVESDNPLHGRTVNPWNAERACGGSSGGEGAIIAARGSPLGLGTDIGGSVRVPAAFCGIASLKPTAGRCPDRGRFSVPTGQQAIVSQIGVLARCVDDVALAMSVVGPGSESEAIPAIGDPAAVGPARLRVGVCADDGTFSPCPAARRAVLQAAEALKAAGATVVEWRPPEVRDAVRIAFGILSADGGAHFRDVLKGGPRHPTVSTLLMVAGRSRPALRILGALLGATGQATLGEFVSYFGYTRTADFWRLCDELDDYRHRFAQAMNRHEAGQLDVLLTPAFALPAYRHGASRDLGLAGGYSLLYNALGYPAGVVPVTRVRAGEESDRPASSDLVEKAARATEMGSAGLPIGVQVAARPWREREVLAAMRVIERAVADDPMRPACPPI